MQEYWSLAASLTVHDLIAHGWLLVVSSDGLTDDASASVVTASTPLCERS
jgi:hypothetical protein